MDIASNYTETLEKTIRDLLERQDDLIRTAFTDAVSYTHLTLPTILRV